MKKSYNIFATVLAVSAILGFTSCPGGASGGKKADKFCEVPVNPDGTKVTEDSEFVYFGMFPQTVLPKDQEGIIGTDTVTMGSNVYYKGSDGNLYAKVLEDAALHFRGELILPVYSDSSECKLKSEDSYRYFKVEPIKWRVLDRNFRETGNALLVADKILTGNVPYLSDDAPYRDDKHEQRKVEDSCKLYYTNYEYSTVRAYLNGSYTGWDPQPKTYEEKGFLQTAFTKKAQNRICQTDVMNDKRSVAWVGDTPSQNKTYLCDDTRDKIFLLSEYEVTRYSLEDFAQSGKGNSRIRNATDYAKATHVDVDASPEYGGDWWLRSPDKYGNISLVSSHGSAWLSTGDFGSLTTGVVPALTIPLAAKK